MTFAEEVDNELRPMREAQENLRTIRELMERSTQHSTFSGLSGVLAGVAAILGAILHVVLVRGLQGPVRNVIFVALWAGVLIFALGCDYLLTKRQAPLVGKHIRSRLGRQMLVAAAPGLGMGFLLTLTFLRIDQMALVFPYWMMAYGTAVRAVGLFSQPEVGRLGRHFLIAGGITLILQVVLGLESAETIGLVMAAVAFGGLHISYGIRIREFGDKHNG